MGTSEHRRSERILLTIPILVMGIDLSGEEYTEETHTVVLNREGALIALQHAMAPQNTLRIINLQTDAAASFRVVGRTRPATSDGTEWGVEYLKEGMNIWGVDFPVQQREGELNAAALLDCQACKNKFFWPVTLMEVEVLNSTGVIQNFCDKCRTPTNWAYADTSRRPPQFELQHHAAPLPQAQVEQERRASKRLLVKLPVFVRNQKGLAETSRTENVSPGDLAVALALELAVEELVAVVCPHTSTGRNLERRALVMRRANSTISGRRLYGMKYVLPAAAGS
jgi:hypothetical protein